MMNEKTKQLQGSQVKYKEKEKQRIKTKHKMQIKKIIGAKKRKEK